jgi:hypothetical protein
MTIDKERYVKIPLWLVTYLIPGLVALLTTISVLSAEKAKQQTKSEKYEQEIKVLQETKVDRNEFTQFMNSLNRIENKLDSHIDRDKK